MKNLVIGDLHFGVKTNNISWLNFQKKLIEEQVADTIINEDPDNIVFLGDLFDIRYAINQVIGIEVKKTIIKLLKQFPNKEFIFIAGNHDYYSPQEDAVEYNAYELVFGKEFVQVYPNAKFINKDPYFVNGELYLPWYWTESTEKFISAINKYKPSVVYCHADLTMADNDLIAALNGIPVYAGHIHYIVENPEKNIWNIGAALGLTFGDSNQDRFIYIIIDGKIAKKIKNVTTPPFKRFYNENIFTLTGEDVNNAFVQLCILDTNINKAQYIEQTKYLKTTYIDADIKINVITDDVIHAEIGGMNLNTNIDNYIETNIPEHLYKKYELIKEKINNED